MIVANRSTRFSICYDRPGSDEDKIDRPDCHDVASRGSDRLAATGYASYLVVREGNAKGANW